MLYIGIWLLSALRSFVRAQEGLLEFIKIMSHSCKALFVSCIDFRFQSAVVKFAADQGLTGSYDLFSIAGTQKNFLNPETQAIALRQVELSQKLHGITQVYLVAHKDCGAYGGSAAFADSNAEDQTYFNDLEQAKKIINEKFPDLLVKKFLAVLENDLIRMDAVE
jgi:carbonic anhydrase